MCHARVSLSGIQTTDRQSTPVRLLDSHLLRAGMTCSMGNTTVQSYNYAHRSGFEAITWERFAELARTLAEKLALYNIDAVVGTARAGLFPATAVCLMLRRELYPARVSRRVNDEVMFQHPQWRVDVAAEVRDKVVAVVDEIADTGETLNLVAARAREKGAWRVITATLVAHSWAKPMPDVVALTTDALVMFPWAERV